MLSVSERLNPGCEHLVGDMRTLRLERRFDAVLIHDGVMYMRTPGELRAAMDTAFAHLRPGGALVLVPDCTLETFEAATEQGGEDDGGRGLRYLMWDLPPEPGQQSFETRCVYVLREGDHTRIVEDRHVLGLFGRDLWLESLAAAGFSPRAEPFSPEGHEAFVGVRPG